MNSKSLATALGSFVFIVMAFSADGQVPVSSNQLNYSSIVTTGGTFQQLIPAVNNNSTTRKSIFIENNNTTDNCYLEDTGLVQVGDLLATTRVSQNSTSTAQKVSAKLGPGGSYNRTAPNLPAGRITYTCDNTGDSIWAVVQ